MKKTKIALAAASIILAGISIAATKPMRTTSNAYNQLRTSPGGTPTACQPVTTLCGNVSGVQCTTIVGLPSTGQSVYVTIKPGTDNKQCSVAFLRDAS